MCFSHSQPTRSKSSLGIHPQLTRSNYADGISSEEQLRVVCLSLIWTKHWGYCVLPFLFVCFFHHRRTQQILKWDDKKIFYFVCITWLNNLWISWESESCPLNGHLDFCCYQTFSTLVKYQNTEDLGKLQSKISTTTLSRPLVPFLPHSRLFIVLPVASYDLLFLPRPHFCCLTLCYFYTTSPHFLIHLCFCGNLKERGKISSLQLDKLFSGKTVRNTMKTDTEEFHDGAQTASFETSSKILVKTYQLHVRR